MGKCIDDDDIKYVYVEVGNLKFFSKSKYTGKDVQIEMQ